MIEIPLTASPEQVFSIAIAGTGYDLRVKYNTRYAVWTMDLSSGRVNLLRGVPLLGGVDIVQQYPSVPLQGLYVVNLENQRLDATSENLGTSVKLFLIEEKDFGATI